MADQDELFDGVQDDTPSDEEVAFIRRLFSTGFIENSTEDTGLPRIVTDVKIGELVDIIFDASNGNRFPATGYIEAIYLKPEDKRYMVVLTPSPLVQLHQNGLPFIAEDITHYRFRNIEIPEED